MNNIEVAPILFNKQMRFTLLYKGSTYTNWLINNLQISYQKLSVVARKHKGKFQTRFIGDYTYVIFNKEEDAQKCADQLNAIIIAKLLVK